MTLILVILALLLRGTALGLHTPSQGSSSASYKLQAERYVAEQKYDQASAAYGKAASIYDRQGDYNAAQILRGQAKRYLTEAELYFEQPVSNSTANQGYLGAKFEPPVGCLTGVNIEHEEMTTDPKKFDRLFGKHQAIFFMYRSYGMPFPISLAKTLKDLGAGLQIAFEPKSIQAVKDDAYLRQFAESARQSGIPIFLRFASEMNGSWTYQAYGADPELYKDKFRIVARTMHEYAPNVAMVWCPNEVPERPIPSYYPGPDVVDWVGVNFYSVYYFDGDRSRPAYWRNPTDALDNIYQLYSKRHPIMIGEWAATHKSVVDGTERLDFAREKIGQLYAALPLKYPRIKAVSWLSMNTIRYAEGPRKLNDFSLFSNPEVAAKYIASTATPYYLPSVEVGHQSSSPIQFSRLVNGGHLPSNTRLVAYVRTYEGSPKVEIFQNGDLLASFTEPSSYPCRLKGSGPATVTIIVTDSKGKVAAKKECKVILD